MARFSVLLVSIILTLNSSVKADDAQSQTPVQAIEIYLDAFNNRSANDKKEAIFHFPQIWIIGGEMKIYDTPPTTLISYDSIEKSGWAYSKAHSIKTLSEGKNTAVVSLDFSRFTEEHKEMLRTVAFYSMIKKGDKWKIATITVASSIPILEKPNASIKEPNRD